MAEKEIVGEKMFFSFARIFLLDEIARAWETSDKSEVVMLSIMRRLDTLDDECSRRWERWNLEKKKERV